MSIQSDPVREPKADTKSVSKDADIRTKAQELYDNGKLTCNLGNFREAIEKLEKAAELFIAARDHRMFIKCLTLNLRMYAEMEDEKSMRAIKDRLTDHVSREKIELNSATYYTFALACTYRNEYPQALEYLEKALALALATDSKEDMCYAIHGLAAL